jgi:nicotinate-nucleotide adenylyltransferase
MEVARSILGQFDLDALLLVPAATPPHKDTRSISGSYQRYAMAALATQGVSNITVSSVELEHPEGPYTYQTATAIRSAYGEEAAIFFVVGSDAFEDMPKWKEPERILEESNIIVAARPGYEISYGISHAISHGNAGQATSSLPAWVSRSIVDLRGPVRFVAETAGDHTRGSIYLTDQVSADVSSTDIRRRVRQGLSIDGLTPPSVIEYIEKYRLYRPVDGFGTAI